MTARVPVTAVVCTRERSEQLAAAVRSLVADLRADDELIVVEAGEPSTAAVPAGASDGCAVRLVHVDVAGKSRQLNRALREATGTVVVCTDDDAVVPLGWVDAMVAPFADARVGVVFGPVTGLTQHGHAAPPPIAPGPAPLATWLYAHGVAMALRTDAARAVGGFDERLGPGAPAHGEEHDLLIRLWEAGWEARIAAAPAVAHDEWRDDAEHDRNLLVYERGGGALVGAALRRHPLRWAGLGARRLRYQWALLRDSPLGLRTVRAFAGGLWYGLRLRPWTGR